jgi:hypothetical protein
MRALAVVFVVLAVGLIALGRHHVRRSRRGGGAPGGKAIGWLLTLVGFGCMLAGVTLW